MDSNHENIVWSTGDKISLFNDVDKTNTELTYSAGGYIEIEVPEATKEIYAHYPYFGNNTDGPSAASVYIGASQTQAAPGTLNGYYFPMVAKGTVSEDNRAIVSFYPVAGALALNIYHTGLNGTETVKSVTVEPTENTGFVGSQITDLTTDAVAYTQPTGTQTSVKVTLTEGLQLSSTAPSDKQKFDGQIYVCLAKQSYKSVKFTIVTDKGTYVITSKSNAFDLVNNDFVPVNINLNKASFTEFSIADGDYVILSYDSANSKYYAMDTDPNGTSQRRDRMEFSYSGGSSVTTDDPTLVWTIAKDNSSYSISGSGMYLSSGNNTAPMSTTAASFTIMSGTTEGTAVVVSGDRFLKSNGNYGFGFYTSSEDLYFIPVTYVGNPVLNVDTTPIIISAYDTESKTVAVSGYLYDTISAGAFEDSEGEISTDWLNVSYANGTISYNSKEVNSSTTDDKEAFIVVTATKGTVSTKKAIKVTQACVPPSASDGDELWVEDFSGFTANDIPLASNSGTIVYGSGSVDYVCGGSGTKVYAANLAGGSAPELLVSKTDGSFSVNGVPTGAATTMTLSYAANNNSLGVSSSTVGITLTKITDKVYKIEASSGITSFDLVFSNVSNGNTRLDNISVVAGAPVASISVVTEDATNTGTTTGSTATLNGSITLVNGASLGDISEAGFYYKLSTSDEYTKVTSTVETLISSNLTGLSANANYNYYAYAIYNGSVIVGSEVYFSTTVSDKVAQDPITFDLSKESYSSASEGSISWTADNVTLKNEKSSSTTAVNNYIPPAKSSTRFYNGNSLTITPGSGCEITSVVFTATSANYATALSSSTWTNASVSVSTTEVTVTPDNGEKDITCAVTGTCGFTKVVVNYKK